MLSFSGILDVLAALGGGRGDPNQEIVRFLLPAIFWAILIFASSNQWLKYRLDRDRIIILASAIGFMREMFMFFVTYLAFRGYIDFNSIHTVFPPLEHTLTIISSVLVAYAFCRYFIPFKKLWSIYIYLGIGVSILLYIMIAPGWAEFINRAPQLKFGSFWGDITFHVSSTVMLLFALMMLLYSKKMNHKIPNMLIIGITFLFLDDFLMIFNLYLKEEYKDIFGPIRHNFHIWSVPTFIALYWNELKSRLSMKEQQIQNIFQLSPGVLCLAKKDGRIILANRATKNILGLEDTTLIGRNLKELGLNLDTLLNGVKEENEVYSITPYVRKDGNLRWLYWKVLYDKNSEQLYINITDITEKKIMEDRLAASEQQYRLLFRYASDAILLFDEQSTIIEDANYSAEMLFGYSVEELRRLSIFDLSAEPEKTHNTIKQLKQHNIRILNIPKRLFKRKDGSVFNGEVNIGIYSVKGKRKCIVSIRDITERLKQEQELRRSEEELRNLSMHLQKIREEERSYIAREIHDELGQLLTAIKIELSSCKRKISSSEPVVLQRLEKSIMLINESISTIKRISMELRPSVLDHLGLAAAVEWYTEEFEERTGIKCMLSIVPPDFNLDKNISITVFRVLQEALTNVSRHSKAKEVIINIKVSDESFYMLIKDDGIGIKDEDVTSPYSFGLLGIRERIRHLDGTLKIQGYNGNGTELEITIPLSSRKFQVQEQ